MTPRFFRTLQRSCRTRFGIFARPNLLKDQAFLDFLFESNLFSMGDVKEIPVQKMLKQVQHDIEFGRIDRTAGSIWSVWTRMLNERGMTSSLANINAEHIHLKKMLN